MNFSTSFFNKTYLAVCYAIIFGTTLLFSTATRSVFEVNKLGIVKISVSILGILYFYDRLIGKKEWFHSYQKNKLLNHGLLFLWGTNALSTVFSKNALLSIFGCYDRWEGLLTISFYLFLIFLIANKKGLSFAKKIIWSIIIASGLSSLYGIIQSYGLDIISWSLDPSMRVFGSINNPVHYCAIMGMSIPIIIGQLFYTVDKNNNSKPIYSHFISIIFYYLIISLISQLITITENSINWILFYLSMLAAPYTLYAYQSIKKPSVQNTLNILFNSLILVIYATYLSYSRATWLSVTATIGLIFTITLITTMNVSKKDFFFITMGCLLLTMSSYLIFLFKLYTTSQTIMILLFMITITSITQILIPFKKNDLLLNIISIGLILISQFFYTTLASTAMLLCFLGLSIYKKKTIKFNLPTKLIAIIIILMNVQFIATSMLHLINFIILFIGLIIQEKTTNKTHPLSRNQIFQWKLITIGIIGLIIIAPTIYLWSTKDNTKVSNSKILVQQASEKINSYQTIAIEGSARTSMWKSAFPWIKENPILGSGLDTIKYYFPNYRRPEYGKLEGGHNYTPDRLHNEYLNTLATKGVVGFIAYYIVFIGGIITSLLLYIKKEESNTHQFLIIGLIGGSLVYLGQVLFNFGVVATLVYFFLFLSLGIAIKTNDETI